MTDGLVEELIQELSRSVDVRQIPPNAQAPSLLSALSSALVWEEYPPATLPELLSHESTFGQVAVILATDLPDHHQIEMPEFLRRLETESRATTRSDRLTVVAIGHRDHLPQFPGGENSDVSMAAIWWWNRVARWDVAAHISHIDHIWRSRVLSDVRTETVVEIARWDLDLAEGLAESWNGDPAVLAECIGIRGGPSDVSGASGVACGIRPHDTVVDLWDTGELDGWHGDHYTAARSLAPDRLSRLVWAAQARILLPWIEERRLVLCERTKDALGQRSFRNALDTLFTPPLSEASGPIEIGPLKTIVEARIGGTNPKLRAAAHRLHSARNKLAHLEPLPFSALSELAAACEWLV